MGFRTYGRCRLLSKHFEWSYDYSQWIIGWNWVVAELPRGKPIICLNLFFLCFRLGWVKNRPLHLVNAA